MLLCPLLLYAAAESMLCVNSFVLVKVFPGAFKCWLLHGSVRGKAQSLHKMENSRSN